MLVSRVYTQAGSADYRTPAGVGVELPLTSLGLGRVVSGQSATREEVWCGVAAKPSGDFTEVCVCLILAVADAGVLLQ